MARSSERRWSRGLLSVLAAVACWSGGWAQELPTWLWTTYGSSGALSLNLSPDGRYVLSVGNRSELRRLPDGEVLRCGSADIRGAAVSPDLRFVASISSPNDKIVIAQAADGRVLREFGTYAHDLCFAPQGDLLASRHADGSVKLWRVANGTLAKNYPVAIARLCGFSPNGSHMAGLVRESPGLEANRIVILRASDGHVVAVLTSHPHSYYHVAFSPDGSWLVATANAGAEVRLELWRTSDWQMFRSVPLNIPMWGGLAWSRDGTRVALGGHSGRAVVFGVPDLRELATVIGPPDEVTALAFSPDGTSLLLGMQFLGVRLVRIADGQVLWEPTAHGYDIPCMAAFPDGIRVATAGFDRSVRIWDSVTGVRLAKLESLGGQLNSVAVSRDGQWLATAADDRKVRVFRTADWSEVYAFAAHGYWALSVAFSSDSQYLASGGADGRVNLWRLEDGQLLWTRQDQTGFVSAVAFSPNGTWVASGGGGTVVLRSASTGDVVKVLLNDYAAEPTRLAFTPDSSMLVGNSPGVWVRSVPEGNLLGSVGLPTRADIHLADDGLTVACFGWTPITIRSIPDLGLVREFRDPIGAHSGVVLPGASVAVVGTFAGDVAALRLQTGFDVTGTCTMRLAGWAGDWQTLSSLPLFVQVDAGPMEHTGHWGVDDSTTFSITLPSAGKHRVWAKLGGFLAEAQFVVTDGYPVMLEFLGQNGSGVLPGDVNDDNRISLEDLSAVLVNFARSGYDAGFADANGDGIVDLVDLSLVLTGFSRFGDP